MAGGRIISLPWPDSRLSPNARTHWRAKAKVAKTARTAAFYLVRSACVEAPGEGVVHLSITFFPPDRRGRDMDNAIASMKPHLDGLADALKVNDNRFRLTFAWGDLAKPGHVEITIGGAE